MKTLGLPRQITIHDTTVREGFQREERLIPTDAKLWVIQQLVKAGFKRLEVTNFASPSRLPQFADAENLLQLIRTHRSLTHHLADIEFSAVTINQTAVDRALAVMLDEMNIETGLDVDTVISIGGTVERIVGRRLRSECLHSGRIAK